MQLNTNTHYQENNTEALYQHLAKYEHNRLVDSRYIASLSKPFKIRAVGYLRVSLLKQGGKDKVSLDEQKVEIKDFIEKNGWDFIRFYKDEGKSGTKKDSRTDFNKMVDEDAPRKIFDVIVGWTTDRLARNVREMTNIREDLKQHLVQVTSVNEPIEIVDPRRLLLDDSGMRQLLSFVLDWKSQQDNKTRTKRFNIGKQGKARKKGLIPCKTPYGLKKHISYKNGDRNKKIEKDLIVPEKAKVVRLIFDSYDHKNFGMRKIAEHINFKGILSPKSGKWGYSTIKYILQNPTYTGAIRWGWRLSESKSSRARTQAGGKGIVVKGNHEAIISYEQFERVQEKLKIRRKLGGRACSSKGLLVGIAKCGLCGGGTYVSHYPHWYAYTKDKKDRGKYKKTLVYFCSNYSQYGRSGCSRRYVISKQKLEALVIKEIKKLANSKVAREAFIKEIKKNNKSKIAKDIKVIEESIGKLDFRRKRQKLAFENAVISLEEFTEDGNEIQQKKDSLEQELENMKKDLNREEEIASKNRNTILALANFDKIWEKADFAKKKELFQTVLNKVIVKDGKIEILFNNCGT